MRVDPGFAERLSGFDLVELDRRANTVFAVDRDFRLTYLNDAWDQFAREGGAEWTPGAWDLGASILDATPGVLRPFYRRLFAEARLGSPVDHDYDCSRPDEVRNLRMRVHRLAPDGWLIVNSDLVVGVEPTGLGPAEEALFRDAAGELVQCSHCRRTRRALTGAWDWVPEWVARIPPDTNHDLCGLCFAYHYGRRNIR